MAKLPNYVKTMSRVAAGFGVCQSALWLVLSTLALVSYLDCSFSQDPADIPASGLFIHTLQSNFFLNEYCEHFRPTEGIVTPYELHIWSAVSIGTSSIWFIVSCCIFFYVTNANLLYVNVTLYLWSIITLAVTSADLALGVIFGLAFSTLGDLMGDESDVASLFELSGIRGAALLLMLVSLRGIVLMIANIVFVVMMLYFAYLVNSTIDRNEHNIHSTGPIYAYQSNKHQPNPWSIAGSEYDDRVQHSAHVNRAYSRSGYDGPPPAAQIPHVGRVDTTPARDDSYGRSFDRSDSWHQTRATNTTPKPFSYLEEPQFFKAPIPPKMPPSSPAPTNAATLPPWKRTTSSLDPGQPNMPSPDYSPPQNRRLKSALKPTAY